MNCASVLHSCSGSQDGILSFPAQALLEHALHEQTCSLQGFEAAKKATLAFLETFKDEVSETDHETLRCAARTSLRTKLYEELADQLTDIVVDAVLTIRNPKEALDLYMVRSGLGL